MIEIEKRYDIRERTYKFAVQIVKFCVGLLKDTELRDIGRQLIRSGTSIGANAEEADGSRTRKEFGNKMTIARNEAKETKYWLRLMIDSGLLKSENIITKAKVLLAECEQLCKILSAIIIKID